jgi:lysozyme
MRSNVVSKDLVDLSNWQKQVMNFKAAKADGVKGVYHKATESDNFVDSWHATRRAQTAGILPFGSYHFARPGDPVAQAREFLKVAAVQPGNLRPMLDLEDPTMGGWSKWRRTRWVKGWVAEVQQVTGVPPVIYTRFPLNRNFDCPLWVARYSDPMWAPSVPKPWKAWSIWQFTNGEYGNPRSVAGIGNCDISTFNTGFDISVLTLPAKLPAQPPARKVPATRGKVVDAVLKLLRKAKGSGRRGRLLATAKASLR